MALQYRFNPATGFFDIVDIASGGSVSKYVQSFNNTTDWTLNVDMYEIQITQATHQQSTSPSVDIYELNSGNYEKVNVYIKFNTSGDVTVSVASSPDSRFQGKLAIY